VKKLLKGGFHCFGYPHQGFDGYDFFPALNFAKVFGVQIHRFRQLLLGEMGVFPMKPDRFTDQLAML